MILFPEIEVVVGSLLAPNHSNMHLHGLTPGYGSKPLGNHSQSGTEAEEQITMHTAVYSEL